MKKIISLIIFILISFSVACSTEQKLISKPEVEKTEMKKPFRDLSKVAKECICIMLWMPVCGDDKKTYGNACQAQCQGVAFTVGECQATR